jgi:hypothetical protein
MCERFLFVLLFHVCTLLHYVCCVLTMHENVFIFLSAATKFLFLLAEEHTHTHTHWYYLSSVPLYEVSKLWEGVLTVILCHCYKSPFLYHRFVCFTTRWKEHGY